MAVQTIGSGLDYATIAAWATAVKADSPLTQTWDGEMQDNGSATYGASSDLDFSGVTLNGQTISLSATTNKHDGTNLSGTYVSTGAAFVSVYEVRNCTVNDMEFVNTDTNDFSQAIKGVPTMNRCIIRASSTGGSGCAVFGNGGFTLTACRLDASSSTSGAALSGTNVLFLYNCSLFGGSYGVRQTGDMGTNSEFQNNVAYGESTASFSVAGTDNTSVSKNNAGDGTWPDTAGEVTLSGDPFEADGFSPSASGQLDGAGTNISVTLDCANNSYDATPSIGAYEVVGAAATPPNSLTLLGVG